MTKHEYEYWTIRAHTMTYSLIRIEHKETGLTLNLWPDGDIETEEEYGGGGTIFIDSSSFEELCGIRAELMRLHKPISPNAEVRVKAYDSAENMKANRPSYDSGWKPFCDVGTPQAQE